MRKPLLSQPKRQGGLSLIPALWEEIDRIAALGGVPRNRVIENALMEKFLPSADSQKVVAQSRKTSDELPELVK
jgi:hypothetical protein